MNDEKFAKYLDESLTEVEKNKIEHIFCNDQVLFNAVRKVLLQAIYISGTIQKGFEVDPQINGAFSLASLALSNPIPDEVVAQQLKAQWAGINYLKNGYDSLSTIKAKKEASEDSEENKAI